SGSAGRAYRRCAVGCAVERERDAAGGRNCAGRGASNSDGRRDFEGAADFGRGGGRSDGGGGGAWLDVDGERLGALRGVGRVSAVLGDDAVSALRHGADEGDGRGAGGIECVGSGVEIGAGGLIKEVDGAGGS